MIPFDEALACVLDAVSYQTEERVSLFEADGRILYKDVIADCDMPPFDKSAMDGYACRKQDVKNPLAIVETIPAGAVPQKTIRKNECAKIMTGAMLPEGADYVVKIEHTQRHEGKVVVREESSRSNICYRAEDIKAGQKVLAKGTKIAAAEVAVLASVGCDPVAVFRRPVVGIISTGSELAEPTQKLQKGQIRNSNGYQLYAQVIDAGCIPRYFGIIKDTPEQIHSIIETKKMEVDVFLLSGGVSMGDYDFVPSVLQQAGFTLLFKKIAIQPGKPTVFGRKGNQYVFGLPGNPVSSFVLFELLVKPFLSACMGSSGKPVCVKGTVKKDILLKKRNRLLYIPVTIDENNQVAPVEYHGSAHIHAYTAAQGIMAVPQGTTQLLQGTEMMVQMIKK